MSAAPLESFASGERLRRMTTSHATDLWLGELERKGESERTVDTYRRLLDKLAGDHPHVDVEELTTSQLRRFLDTQARKRNGDRKADATIAQNVSIVCGFMDWLAAEGVIGQNPTRRNGLRIIARPRLVAPEENDNVVTVTSADVGRLLEAANRSGRWNRRLAVHCLVYLGPRRRAIARARIGDYDPDGRTIQFREKGGKTIRKPVPGPLADLIDAAIAAGVYADESEGGSKGRAGPHGVAPVSRGGVRGGSPSVDPDAYLIPGNADQRRPGERDDRVIWRLVREVADDAGVTTHVHALRAAFAVRFLEQKPGQLVALQKLMGHRRIETTMVYLRRYDRQRSMETVRDLDWSTGVAPHDNVGSPQIAAKLLESFGSTEKEGFEPSFDAKSSPQRAGSHRGDRAPLVEALEQRIRELEAFVIGDDR